MSVYKHEAWGPSCS